MKKQMLDFLVGFNRRFSKQFSLIKEFISQSREPMIVNYRVNAGSISPNSWLNDPEQGGRIIGEACHFIDIFDFLIESEPISVYASSIDGRDESVVVTITYSDGSIANLLYLTNGNNLLRKEYCEIFTGGLIAIMDDFKKVILINNKQRKFKFDGRKGHEEEISHFVKVLRGEERPKLSFESVFKTTLITFKIIESYKSRKSIYL